MAGEPFVDTNVVLRHLLQDDHDHSPRATALFEAVGRGELSVRIAPSVVFETVFVLDRRNKAPKAWIRAAVLEILALPELLISERARLERALDLFVERNIPYIDAYHAAAMVDLGCTQILSFDRHFDRIPGIERVEP